MINIAILGFGTVGSGVAEVLDINRKKIAEAVGQEVSVRRIVDVRTMPDSPYAHLITNDFSLVENDPQISIVVETIGGAGVAYDFTRRCLLAGKSVVTSNKELVATHGPELLKIAAEKNVNYFCEAAVGGGIPVLRPLGQCLAANQIEEIYGILNGTTNYVLTEMIQNGIPFETALKQAQQLGYAEADPTADVEGHDACRKICILAAIGFGFHIYPEQVPTEGISRMTLADVRFAARKGYKIKLLGRAVRTEDGKVCAYVAPHLIGEEDLLSHVDGVMNGISVTGNAVGKTMFYGPGAGKLPTASAVVADVIDAAQHTGERKPFGWRDCEKALVGLPDRLETRWYIRTAYPDTLAGERIGEDAEFAAYITEKTDRAGAERLAGGCQVFAMFRILD